VTKTEISKTRDGLRYIAISQWKIIRFRSNLLHIKDFWLW